MNRIRDANLTEFFALFEAISEREAIKDQILCALKAMRILVPALVDCLRLAGDMDGGEIYDLLAKASIIQREPFDPVNADHQSLRDAGLVEGIPGEEVWILTDLGKQFTEVR